MLDDLQVKALTEELWELSEHEEQNIARMKEIAHVLVNHYLHRNDNENGLQRKEEKVE